MSKQVLVIGAGFGGLSAAGYLAKAGYNVTIVEKNSWVGGRAQVYEQAGYKFDMGPSWYLLHEEHEKWFRDMGTERSEYYGLYKLDPQYKVFFDDTHNYTLPGNLKGVAQVFESIEPGAGGRLATYLKAAKQKHDLSIEKFIYNNYNTIPSIINKDTLTNAPKMDMFKSYRTLVNKYFKHPYIRAMLEYPTVFLGASATTIPALYTLMNWVDFGQGAYYPEGGFGRVVESMAEVVKKLGVKIELNTEVKRFIVNNKQVSGVVVSQAGVETTIPVELVVSNADYHHIDQVVTHEPFRQFSESHWDKLFMAPSTINLYVAINKKLTGLEHHTFFFDADWDGNFEDVYKNKKLNKKPLFYLHVPSQTDPNTAPKDCTSMFILIPTAPGVLVDQATIQNYFDQTIKRIERLTNQSIRGNIAFFKSYTAQNYTEDYNAYKGTAFGLGHTLFQTASFRPPNKSKKLTNLYFCGQYSIPGTGTSMSMIGGKVVSERIVLDKKAS
jgi:phytoene desaturase